MICWQTSGLSKLITDQYSHDGKGANDLPSESYSTTDAIAILQDLGRCGLVVRVDTLWEHLLKESFQTLRGKLVSTQYVEG